MNFPEKLTVLMKKRALSQYELARQLGVSTSMVHGWLNGSRPQRRITEKLADFFHETVESLLDDMQNLRATMLDELRAITKTTDNFGGSQLTRTAVQDLQLSKKIERDNNQASAVQLRAYAAQLRTVVGGLEAQAEEHVKEATRLNEELADMEKAGAERAAKKRSRPIPAGRKGPPTRSPNDYIPPGATLPQKGPAVKQALRKAF